MARKDAQRKHVIGPAVVTPCRHGQQVVLKCSCGRWSAMTVAYGPYTVKSCIRSLLSGSDGVHTVATYSGGDA